jgi:hypothetical protein
MEHGTLTSRSNGTVEAYRFTGQFGQPDGFGSVLTARVKTDGRLVLTLVYLSVDVERTWTVELDTYQRGVLGQLCNRYQPRLYERIDPSEA